MTPAPDIRGAWRLPRLLFGALLLIGVVLSAVAGAVDTERFLFAYLAAYGAVFFIAIGMLVFVLVHHVTDAGWSTVPRRWAEQVLDVFPLLVVGLVPILAFPDVLYPWAGHHEGGDGHDLGDKAVWLNETAWRLRSALYVLALFALSRWFAGRSFAQDTSGDGAISFALRKWSGPALVVTIVLSSAAAVDWYMTLDPHWYSTMFGIYVGSQGALAAYAGLYRVSLLAPRSALGSYVRPSQVHDLGKWTFALSAFWAYLAFSQFMLIWYANIPEETLWMTARWGGGYTVLTVSTIVLLFVVPFLLLMPAAAKTNPWVGHLVTISIHVGHLLGMSWLVLPAYHHGGATMAQAWMDVGAYALWLGAAGTAVLFFARGRSWVPSRDPRLPEALADGHAHDDARREEMPA